MHGVGGKLYYDGANANAILGISRPGDMGFDVVHFNLHKTFSTPHGGGGPGPDHSGSKELIPYLPIPLVVKEGETYRLQYDRPLSIGRVKSFYGNFGVVVRAYAYIRSLGPKGLREVSEMAVLHANYLMRKLEPYFELPYQRHCKHEFVLSGKWQKAQGVRTLDIAKRLLDYGIHAPTIYFPLIVEEAIMVEPTETETKETMDAFVKAMVEITGEAKENPALLHEAPHNTPVRHLDETKQPVNLICVGSQTTMAKECWRLIKHAPASGAWNMEVDVAECSRRPRRAADPAFLCVATSEHFSSLGYNQKRRW